MTVNEMIAALQTHAARGHGEKNVITTFDDLPYFCVIGTDYDDFHEIVTLRLDYNDEP